MAENTPRSDDAPAKTPDGAAPKKSIAGRAAAAAGGVVAAATLAAGIAMAPAPAPSARLDGVHADLARAVALRQITDEQAAFLEAQIARSIASEEAVQTADGGASPAAETA